MITCSQCRDELAEYALGHSPAMERMDEHLRTCVVCRRDLAEIEAAWAALPLALPASSPPDRLFDRLAARLGADAATTTLAPARNRPTQDPILSRRARRLSYLLAASVLAALTLAATAYYQQDRPGEALGSATPEEQTMLDLAQRLGNLQQMERLLNSGNVKLVATGEPGSPDAVRAFVVWDLAANQWHFFARNLPPAPADRVYQLWIADGLRKLVPGPTFAADAEGVGSAVVDLPALGAPTATKAIVTLEPAGGSQQPTGEPVLEAAL